MSYTLITGATGVIGKAFAIECAQRGYDLFLTGRSREKLSVLKDELSRFPINIQFCECDLADEKSRNSFFEYAKNFSFERLISVAGADIQKPFSQYTQEKITFQIRANFEGAAAFSHFVLSQRGEKCELLAVSSVCGIYPMPYFALYSASKNALTYLYCALHEEYKKEGVKICVVLPGSVPTREDVIADIEKQGLWAKMAKKSPEYVVKKSLCALEKNRRCVVLGFLNKVMNVVTKIIPLGIKIKFIGKTFSKKTKDAF